jgi:DNA-binding MarR family transcriptional regulator
MLVLWEKCGLISRARDPKDERQVIISLTRRASA